MGATLWYYYHVLARFAHCGGVAHISCNFLMDTELTGYEVISISFDVYDDALTHEDQANLSNSLLARYRGSTWISNSLETVVEAITEESGYTISYLSIKSINIE